MAKIDESYHNLLNNILEDGFKYEDPNRKGINRIQIPSYTIKHDFENGFPAITTKKLYWKGVVGELIWFLRGDTNIKYLVDNGINIWNKDAANYYLKHNPRGTEKGFKEGINERNHIAGDLGRVYGAQWRNWADEKGIGYIHSTIDQISNLIKGLKENPMGTRHIVTAWNPAELNDMALPPCHWSFEILVEPIYENKRYNDASNLGLKKPEYKFTLKWHQRSVDTFLGLPFNIASYALLAHIIGKLTNMKPKGIIGDLSNVHIYEPHLDAVKEQLSRNINEHGECELHTVNNSILNINPKEENLDELFRLLMIQDFELKNYNSHSRIPAEMLAYNK